MWRSGSRWSETIGARKMASDYSEAALDWYYAETFEKAYGYDPYEGPYEDEEEDE